MTIEIVDLPIENSGSFHSYGGAITILNMLVAGISKQSGCLVIFLGYVLLGGAISPS